MSGIYCGTSKQARRIGMAFVLCGLLLGMMTTAPRAQADSEQTAAYILETANKQRGVCAVLGVDDDVALNLALYSELLVHVRDPRAEAIADIRKQADQVGLTIQRLVAERGELNRLPWATNTVDIVVATGISAERVDELSLGEILRAMRPGGLAIIGRGESATVDDVAAFEKWIASTDVENAEVNSGETGTWLQFTKPPLRGAGDWSHWEHGPDNNPVASDTVIKAPYMTQFMAKPFYIAIPSITTVAGGRSFLAIGHIAHHRREWEWMNKLIARNGYNGTVLWERQLPEGYLVHRSAFIATKDKFHMIDGNRCLLLDPETGRDIGEIRIPGVLGDWKWMVMQNGVLYVLAGRKDAAAELVKGDRAFGGWSWADLSTGYYTKPHVPWGFGNTLVAYDLENENVLWKHTEEIPIDSRAMSLGKEKIFLYSPGKHLRCLNLESGEVEWTNEEKTVLDLIEEPGQGLTSTPGFRTACLAVYTPDALIIQGQTRQNVVAISTADGYHLWTKKKVTNNPNAIYVDGKVILGVGPNGQHVALEPTTGNELENLLFRKQACTRLTASSDSFFVRGEGMLRYDRDGKFSMIDGAVRPACNDGALPANGLLYLGPWQCDCNLSLIGVVARCSAGDFRFDYVATEEERLEKVAEASPGAAPFEMTSADWPTYRANIHRTGGTSATVAQKVAPKWIFNPQTAYQPTEPVAAGGLVFSAGNDGKVRAVDAAKGVLKWQFATAGEIKTSPTVADGRVYVGSGDGHVYALEAATGKLLWRFRAAPIERHTMIYGSMTSTWPVNSGVLVQDGIAYFAAGIIDHDGTYVYALDAKTGEIKWQNNSSGHLNPQLRKGVSVQGNLTIQGDRLLMAGGNQISPAPYDLKTGECLADPKQQGRPQANNGRYLGVLQDKHVIGGGRILFSAAENVATKGSFTAYREGRPMAMCYGGIPPAWDDETLALVNFRNGQLTCCETPKVAERIGKNEIVRPGDSPRSRRTLADYFSEDKAIRWQSNLGESNKFEAVSLAVCPNAIVAVVQFQLQFRAQPQWFVVAFNKKTGAPFWRQELRAEPLPGGLLVDRDGQVVVTMLNGGLRCLGEAG